MKTTFLKVTSIRAPTRRLLPWSCFSFETSALHREFLLQHCLLARFKSRSGRWRAGDVTLPESGLPANPRFLISFPSKFPRSPRPQAENGPAAIETSEGCLNDPNRSRVCYRSGSPARDLQNHGNTALATGWYVSHDAVIPAHLDVFLSQGRIPSQGLDVDTRAAYLESRSIQG